MMERPMRPDAASPPVRLTEGGAETGAERAIAALVSKLPSPSAAITDASVERVWRRVTAPPVSWRYAASWWFPALGLAALLVAVVRGPFFRGPSPVAEVALASGSVVSSGATAREWHTSQAGEVLREADRLRTGPTGQAVFRVAGVAAVLVGGDSDVGLEQLAHGTSVRLSRGALTARVSKRKPDEPFVVKTARYTVTVVGTLFTVEDGPGEHVAVSVREGVVLVSEAGGVVARVSAGERWANDSAEIQPDRTPDAVKMLLESTLQRDASARLESVPSPVRPPPPGATPSVVPPPAAPRLPSAPTAGAAPPATPARTEASPAERSVAPVAPHSEPPARPEPAASVPVASPASVASAAASAAPLASSAAPSAPAPAESAVAPAPAPVPVDEGPYARGLALEAKGDLEGAARELSRAADIDPQHGDIALYALGRLAQRRLHDPARARAAFGRYRDRYPRGSLLAEVDLAVLEIEIDSHASSEALAASSRFLSAHPGSERVDEVHMLRGNLLRDAGRCAEALHDYSSVRTAPFTDHALYSTAYCQRKLGDRVAAAGTLRDYLVRFPNGAHRTEATEALSEEH